MKRLFYLFTSLILLATTFFFQSCSDEKYTVWTGSETYSEFYNLTQVTINDGYYIRWEITESQWNEFSKKLSKKERNRWDEETIKKWLKTFIRRFFSQQFKRSCMPDGPQVCSVTLSPRGGWMMPSDAWSTDYLENL